jgi:diketogulonate reductase-like aldo/keto reductase
MSIKGSNLHRYTSIGGQDTTKPLPYNPSESVRKQVEASFQNSLANLRTTYVDSYILHSPLKTIEHTLEAWRALMALQDEGKVRMIGVSNTYDVKILRALSRERKVQVVQNRWYEGNGWDKQVLNYCQEHDIQYQ